MMEGFYFSGNFEEDIVVAALSEAIGNKIKSLYSDSMESDFYYEYIANSSSRYENELFVYYKNGEINNIEVAKKLSVLLDVEIITDPKGDSTPSQFYLAKPNGDSEIIIED